MTSCHLGAQVLAQGNLTILVPTLGGNQSRSSPCQADTSLITCERIPHAITLWLTYLVTGLDMPSSIKYVFKVMVSVSEEP
jgi:hypothetical protein